MATYELTLADWVASLRNLSKAGGDEAFLRSLGRTGVSETMLETLRTGGLEAEVVAAEAMIGAMTLDERSNPDKIPDSRRLRIASDSGVSVDKVQELLSQFRQMSMISQRLSALRTRR